MATPVKINFHSVFLRSIAGGVLGALVAFLVQLLLEKSAINPINCGILEFAIGFICGTSFYVERSPKSISFMTKVG